MYDKFIFWGLLWVIGLFCCLSCGEAVPEVGKWDRFEGIIENTEDYSDPYRDVQLDVEYRKPDGSLVSFPGFYDGEQQWKFRFMPDQEGSWTYKARFSDDSEILSGSFQCVESGLSGPLSVYTENPLWFGTRGGEAVLVRSLQVGDRFFAENFDSLDRLKFLDWAQEQRYNMLSISSHYLNRRQRGRGLGWTTPQLWPLDAAEYRKMEYLLDELAARELYVFPFAGFFGRAADWPIDPEEQERYVQYTLSRIAPYRNVLFNVAGPEPLLKPEEYQRGNLQGADIHRLGTLIKSLDPFDHLLSVHNQSPRSRGSRTEADPFMREPWEDYAVFQGGKTADLWKVYDFINRNRVQLKPIFAQEVLWPGNRYHSRLDAVTIRKKALVLHMAASSINFADQNGNSASGFSGSMDLDVRNQERHDAIHAVWNFFESLSWYEMEPIPEAIDQGFCLGKAGEEYLFYLPPGDTVFIYPQPGDYTYRWTSTDELAFGEEALPYRPDTVLMTPDTIHSWLLLLSGELE